MTKAKPHTTYIIEFTIIVDHPEKRCETLPKVFAGTFINTSSSHPNQGAALNAYREIVKPSAASTRHKILSALSSIVISPSSRRLTIRLTPSSTLALARARMASRFNVSSNRSLHHRPPRIKADRSSRGSSVETTMRGLKHK